MEELFALPEGEWLRIRPSLARLRRLLPDLDTEEALSDAVAARPPR